MGELPLFSTAIQIRYMRMRTVQTSTFFIGIEVDRSQGNSPVDLRPSSISIGSSSAIILVILIVAIVILDSEGCYRAVRYRGK